jgi:isoleucyl-tRNA synthetase
VAAGEADGLPADAELVAAMDSVSEVCSTVLGLRKARGLRVRQPLQRLTVATADADALGPYADLVAAEVNVRTVVLSTPEEADVAVTRRLAVNPRAAGPRLGKDVQQVIRAAKAGDWSLDDDGTVTAGGTGLLAGEYELQTVVEGDGADAEPGELGSGSLGSGGFVVLDTVVTEELAAEGVARDLVRAVQQARRDAGLAVSDRIRLGIDGGDDITDAVETHRQLIMRETLASTLELGTVPAETYVDAVVGDGLKVRVTVEHAG